jgi:hypothetical protein
MILDDVHVELLDGFQEEIAASALSSYICLMLECAIIARYDVDEFDDSPVAMQIFEDMTNAIHEALDGHLTVYVYLQNVVPGFSHLDSETRHNFAALARIAWLDKMIETRTIA